MGKSLFGNVGGVRTARPRTLLGSDATVIASSSIQTEVNPDVKDLIETVSAVVQLSATADPAYMAAQLQDLSSRTTTLSQLFFETSPSARLLSIVQESIAAMQKVSATEACNSQISLVLQMVRSYLTAYVEGNDSIIVPLFEEGGFDAVVADIDAAAQACAAAGTSAYADAVELASKSITVAQRAHAKQRGLEQEVDALKVELARKDDLRRNMDLSVGLQVSSEFNEFYMRYAILYGHPAGGLYDALRYADLKRKLEAEQHMSYEQRREIFEAELAIAKERLAAAAALAASEAELAAAQACIDEAAASDTSSDASDASDASED